MIMNLLCAMACRSPINVGMPRFCVNVAVEYLSMRLLLACHFSQSTVTPSLVAFRSGSSRNFGTASNNPRVVSLKIENSSPAMKSLMTERTTLA